MHREMGRVGVTQGWGAHVIPMADGTNVKHVLETHTRGGCASVDVLCDSQ